MAAKGSVEAIIEVAKKELGTIEGPKDNETKYGAWMKVNFQPWCQSFVSWCAFTAGVAKFPKSASTVAASDQFKKEVLRIAAHDLRNPISAIQGFAQLMVKDLAGNEKMTEYYWLPPQEWIKTSEPSARTLDKYKSTSV